MAKSKAGDADVFFPAAAKFVEVSMVPSLIPWDATDEEIFVIVKPAVNGLARLTETWAMSLACPVVGNTMKRKSRDIHRAQY